FCTFFSKWMPSYKKPKALFSKTRALMPFPLRQRRKSLGIGLRGLPPAKNAKETMLPHSRIALRFLRAFHRFVQNRHDLSTITECIHSTALDQRLHHAFVEKAQINFFAEFKDRTEAAYLLASSNDGINCSTTDVFDGRQPESD